MATGTTIDFPNAKVNTKNVLPKQTYTLGDTITFVFPVGVSGFVYFLSTSDVSNRVNITNSINTTTHKWVVQGIDTTHKGKFQLSSSSGIDYYSDSLIIRSRVTAIQRFNPKPEQNSSYTDEILFDLTGRVLKDRIQEVQIPTNLKKGSTK